MKNVFIFTLLGLLWIAIVSCDSKHRTFHSGCRQNDSRLYVMKGMEKSASYFGRKVKIEETILTRPGFVITYIESTNLNANSDNGPECIIRGGGPGQAFITLKYKSQRFRGINHELKIYAVESRFYHPEFCSDKYY